MVKDPEQYVFHEGAVLRPSDREVKYHDRRARPGGKVWDSVWEVNPFLVGELARPGPRSASKLAG